MGSILSQGIILTRVYKKTRHKQLLILGLRGVRSSEVEGSGRAKSRPDSPFTHFSTTLEMTNTD